MLCFPLFVVGLASLVSSAATADCPDGGGSSTCNGIDLCCSGILQCNKGEIAACLTGCMLETPDCFPLCEDGNDQTTSGVCTTVPITASDYSHQIYGTTTSADSHPYSSSTGTYVSTSAATTTTTMSSTATMTMEMAMTTGPNSEAVASTLTATSTSTAGGRDSGSSSSRNNSPTAKPGAGTSTSTNASVSKAAAVAMVTEAPVMAFAAVLAGAVLL